MSLPILYELRDAKEDWTGKTQPAERKKLQNRLNQRALSMTSCLTPNAV